MKAILATALFFASVPAFAQSIPPEWAALKPMVDTWRKCSMEKAGRFISSGEPAETIAKVALYECRDERINVHQAMLAATGSAARANPSIEKLEYDIREYLISLVVQAKAK